MNAKPQWKNINLFALIIIIISFVNGLCACVSSCTPFLFCFLLFKQSSSLLNTKTNKKILHLEIHLHWYQHYLINRMYFTTHLDTFHSSATVSAAFFHQKLRLCLIFFRLKYILPSILHFLYGKAINKWIFRHILVFFFFLVSLKIPRSKQKLHQK